MQMNGMKNADEWMEKKGNDIQSCPKHIFSLSLEYSQECVPDAKLTHEIDAFKRCISPFLHAFNGC